VRFAPSRLVAAVAARNVRRVTSVVRVGVMARFLLAVEQVIEPECSGTRRLSNGD